MIVKSSFKLLTNIFTAFETCMNHIYEFKEFPNLIILGLVQSDNFELKGEVYNGFLKLFREF